MGWTINADNSCIENDLIFSYSRLLPSVALSLNGLAGIKNHKVELNALYVGNNFKCLFSVSFPCLWLNLIPPPRPNRYEKIVLDNTTCVMYKKVWFVVIKWNIIKNYGILKNIVSRLVIRNTWSKASNSVLDNNFNFFSCKWFWGMTKSLYFCYPCSKLFLRTKCEPFLCQHWNCVSTFS